MYPPTRSSITCFIRNRCAGIHQVACNSSHLKLLPSSSNDCLQLSCKQASNISTLRLLLCVDSQWMSEAFHQGSLQWPEIIWNPFKSSYACTPTSPELRQWVFNAINHKRYETACVMKRVITERHTIIAVGYVTRIPGSVTFSFHLQLCNESQLISEEQMVAYGNK
jgi:hypothetical protein